MKEIKEFVELIEDRGTKEEIQKPLRNSPEYQALKVCIDKPTSEMEALKRIEQILTDFYSGKKKLNCGEALYKIKHLYETMEAQMAFPLPNSKDTADAEEYMQIMRDGSGISDVILGRQSKDTQGDNWSEERQKARMKELVDIPLANTFLDNQNELRRRIEAVFASMGEGNEEEIEIKPGKFEYYRTPEELKKVTDTQDRTCGFCNKGQVSLKTSECDSCGGKYMPWPVADFIKELKGVTDTQDNDGWIEWDCVSNNICPVEKGVYCEVRFRNGKCCVDYEPEEWNWGKTSAKIRDIVAYRIVKESKKQTLVEFVADKSKSMKSISVTDLLFLTSEYLEQSKLDL